MSLSTIALRPNAIPANTILHPNPQMSGSSFSGRVWNAYSSSMDDASSFLRCK